MSRIDDILGRLPAERREAFLRIVHDLDVRPDSPELAQAYLAVEALAPLLDEVRGASDDISTAMRAAASEIVGRMSRDIAAETTTAIKDAVQGEIVEHLRAQQDVALAAHDRARRAVENLEGEVAGHVHEIAAKAQRTMQMHSARYPVVIWTLVMALLFSIYHGEWAGYQAGYSQAWHRAVTTQTRMDARAYLHNPLKWRAEAERAK